MSFFSSLFGSNWQRVGEDALGPWPVVYHHRKTGDVDLIVQHNTPANYWWAMRRAGWMAFALFAGWVWLAYTIVGGMHRTGKSFGWIPTLIFLTVAGISLAMPKYLAQRRMNKHPSTGKSQAVLKIRKGKITAPGGEKSTVDQFHSATGHPHFNSKDEAHSEEIWMRRQQQQGTPIIGGDELYRRSSCVRVLAGHRGAHVLCTIEFCNDPHQQWAGTAAAAVDYAVALAKAAAPASSQAVTVSAFRVTQRRTVAREI
jgi:hypothetical protein